MILDSIPYHNAMRPSGMTSNETLRQKTFITVTSDDDMSIYTVQFVVWFIWENEQQHISTQLVVLVRLLHLAASVVQRQDNPAQRNPFMPSITKKTLTTCSSKQWYACSCSLIVCQYTRGCRTLLHCHTNYVSIVFGNIVLSVYLRIFLLLRAFQSFSSTPTLLMWL